MPQDPGAFWDIGLWDVSKWDTQVAVAAWTGKDDNWTSSFNSRNTYDVLWTGGDDVWASNVRVSDPYSAVINESPDIWAITIVVHAPDTSVINEKPDIWNALIYATLHPPIYGAGGGWGWSVWGDRYPDWRARWKNLNDAYDNWRYLVNVRIREKGDVWGARVDSYPLSPTRVKAQQELMFGSTTFVDWEEEAIIEELLK